MLTKDTGWHLLHASDSVKGRKALLLPGLLERTGDVSFSGRETKEPLFLVLLFEVLSFQSLYLVLLGF